jgi:hypothetical protein
MAAPIPACPPELLRTRNVKKPQIATVPTKKAKTARQNATQIRSLNVRTLQPHAAFSLLPYSPFTIH